MKHGVYNHRGNMVVNTGFKKFDAATTCISTGNVFATTQRSFFIRPYSEIHCNGFTFKEGELMRSDMKYFDYIAPTIREILCNPLRKSSLILYEFFVGYDDIGQILTTADYHLITSVVFLRPHQNAEKRSAVINEMLEYVTCDGTTDVPEDVLTELRHGYMSGEDLFTSIAYRDDREYILQHHCLDHETNGPVPKESLCIYIYDLANSATRLLDTVPVDKDIRRCPKSLAKCYCLNPFVGFREIDGRAIVTDSDGNEIMTIADTKKTDMKQAINDVNRFSLTLNQCKTTKETADFLAHVSPKSKFRIGDIGIG